MFLQLVGAASLSFFCFATISMADLQLNPLLFPRQGLKTISLSTSAPLSAILRFASRGRSSGGGVAKLCRRFLMRKGECFSRCADTADTSIRPDKQKTTPNGGGPLIRAPTPSLLLQTAYRQTSRPRHHVVDARGIQTVVDGGRES